MQNMQKKSKKMHEYAKKITENMQEICRICISGIFANLHIYIYIYTPTLPLDQLPGATDVSLMN